MIQNEIMAILGKQIQDKLVDECNASGHFALLADETTDKSTKEQLTIFVSDFLIQKQVSCGKSF